MTDDLLATLAAERDIRRLISAYCDAICRRDADAAGRLFAPDATVRIAHYPELQGRDAIVEGMRATFGHFSFLYQKCDTGIIDVDGDRACARYRVLESNRAEGKDSFQLIFGSYEDEYRLLDEGWRFSRRVFSLQMRTMVPATKIQDQALPEALFSFQV